MALNSYKNRKETANIMVDLHNGGHIEIMASPEKASVALGGGLCINSSECQLYSFLDQETLFMVTCTLVTSQ